MVAPEGKSFILTVALVTLISVSLAWGIGIVIFRLISLVLIVFLGFCFIFFRDPSRTIPVGDNLLTNLLFTSSCDCQICLENVILTNSSAEELIINQNPCTDISGYNLGDINQDQLAILLTQIAEF